MDRNRGEQGDNAGNDGNNDRQGSGTTPSPLDIGDGEKWGERTLSLLKEEQDEEAKAQEELYASSTLKELEEKGLCLRKLRLEHMSNGLQGRVILTLETARGSEKAPIPLPSSKIKVGALVEILHKGSLERLATGTVTKFQVSRIGIEVDAEDADEFPEHSLVVRLLTDTVTFKKNAWTLQHLYDEEFPGHNLVKLLLLQTRTLIPPSQREELHPFNTALNESQLAAVQFALSREDICVLHGPPGTGKTTTVVEIVAQHVQKGRKVLLAAASNMAVDNVMERLLKYKINAVRIGHPSRTLDSVKDRTLMTMVNATHDMSIVKDIYAEIKGMTAQGKGKGAGNKRNERTDWRMVKELRKDARKRESAVIAAVLKGAQVVCGTTTTINRHGVIKTLDLGHFDVAVVDEAGQALEIAAWAAVLQAPRCILAGDHLQLPPTVKSTAAAEQGLAVSLLERAVHLFGDEVTCMLTTQYRMHAAIQGWSSDHLYNSALQPADLVASHRLCDIDGVEDTEETSNPLVFVDTSGGGCFESTGEDGISKKNDGEAAIVLEHATLLVAAGVSVEDIGIITPYNLQVEKIRALLAAEHLEVEVSSVDGFQGREKEAIIISLVRSNAAREVGFLRDFRRINVAVTRARRHLCVIGNSGTVASDPHMASLVAYLHEHSLLSSVYNYEAGSAFLPSSQGSAKQDRGGSASKQIKFAEPPAHTHRRKPSSKAEREQLRKERERQAAEKEAQAKTRIEGILTDLLQQYTASQATSPSSYPLSTTLSSYERRLMHQLCEEKGYGHESIGEGAERKLVVTLGPLPSEKGATGDENAPAPTTREGARGESSVAPLTAPFHGSEDGLKPKAHPEGDDDAGTLQRRGFRNSHDESVAEDANLPPPAPESQQHAAGVRDNEEEGKEDTPETDVQRMLRLRKERIEAQRAEMRRKVDDSFLASTAAKNNKKKRAAEAAKKKSKAASSSSVQKGSSNGHILGPLPSKKKGKKTKDKEAAALDALVAAIDAPKSSSSAEAAEEVQKQLPFENQLQRNPFLDAAQYARSGFADKGVRTTLTSEERRKQQLKKKLAQSLADQKDARKTKQAKQKKNKKK